MESRSVAFFKLQLAFGAAIVVLIAVGAISYRALIASSKSDRWVQHTYEVLDNLNDLLAGAERVESSYRGFALTGDETHLQSYHQNAEDIARAENAVRELTTDNPVQQQRITNLERLISEKIQFGDQVIDSRRTRGLVAASDALRDGPGPQLMREIEGQVREMQDEELRLLALRNSDAQLHSDRTRVVLLLGTLLGILIAIGAGWIARRDHLARESAEDALRLSEERLTLLIEGVRDYAIFLLDPAGLVVTWNEGARRIKGYTAGEIVGQHFSKFYTAESVEQGVPAQELKTAKGKGRSEDEGWRVRKDGSLFWANVIITALRDKSGRLRGFAQVTRDFSERQAAQDELFAEKERAQVTLNSIGDAVVCTNLAGNVSFLNPVAEKLTGWSQRDAAGRPVAEVLHILVDSSREVVSNPMELAVAENRTLNLPSNSLLVRRDGTEIPIEDSVAPIHDRQGRGAGAVIAFRDVTVARAMERQLAYSAQHDFLTGLPNRMLLIDRVSQAIAASLRHNGIVAVMFLDLDGFKHINDSLGHLIGDKVLQSVAGRLRECLRGSDTVSRQGGDEFVVLLSDVQRIEDAAFTATRMLHAIAAPHTIDDRDLHVTASIGISVYPDDGANCETLIKNADTAMYHAKEHGRQCYEFFRPAMNARAVARQSIEEDLRRALERREFVLHYQPKVDLTTGGIAGAEALIRWVHPTRGLVAPSEFIPVAEDCGLILPIGNWVLRESCRQARAWLDAGLSMNSMAVNVSAMEFRDKQFGEGVIEALDDAGLNPKHLQLELTEGILMKNAESTESILNALRARGVQVAIDDFGTGYSSLSYLTRFPIDTLKIDQSFVHQVATSEGDTPIVTAIISMGRDLNMRVVAEGVETQEQAAFLRAHHCDQAQGYYFGRPVGAEEFAVLLRTGLAKGVATNVN
jgi:diguanylate cyclase (GGDEF)-like protein/PAS domain S-box-containing protein